LLDINPRIVTKDQVEKFKSLVKNNILDNVIQAFQSIETRPQYRNLYDRDLGFGQAPPDTHLGLESQ
jgi:hypothetical protein